jgi:hypothetical protein
MVPQRHSPVRNNFDLGAWANEEVDRKMDDEDEFVDASDGLDGEEKEQEELRLHDDEGDNDDVATGDDDFGDFGDFEEEQETADEMEDHEEYDPEAEEEAQQTQQIHSHQSAASQQPIINVDAPRIVKPPTRSFFWLLTAEIPRFQRQDARSNPTRNIRLPRTSPPLPRIKASTTSRPLRPHRTTRQRTSNVPLEPTRGPRPHQPP